MSVQAISWAMYADHRGELDPVSRFVLVVLADHVGADGVAWPSRQRIAATTGTSLDTIDRRLHELVAAGLVERLAADDPRVPAAWHAMPANRRPTAYLLSRFLGPQAAAPDPSRGRRTDVQGPQDPAPGAAAVRHKQEQNQEQNLARAREAAPRPPDWSARPDSARPCAVCRHIHPPDEPHPRRQPVDVAHRGAAAARQALTRARLT